MFKHEFSSVTRPLIASLALACSWLVSLVLEGVGAPIWALSINAGVILLSLAALIVMVHRATVETGEDQDHGRGGRRRPEPDAPRPEGGGDPSWWPEFERELARYIAERQARVPAAASSGTARE